MFRCFEIILFLGMVFIFLQDIGIWASTPRKHGARVMVDFFLVLGMFIGLFVKGC